MFFQLRTNDNDYSMIIFLAPGTNLTLTLDDDSNEKGKAVSSTRALGK